MVPELDPSTFLAASYNPDDGVVFPWPFLWGYATRAEALGREGPHLHPRHRLPPPRGPALTHVETDRGAVACGLVVNAAGAWSKAGGGAGRGGHPEPPHPPRDPGRRAARALARPAGLAARQRPLLLAVAARRAGGRHGRSGRAGGDRPGLDPPLPGPLRPRRHPGGAAARRRQGDAPVGRLLRRDARQQPHPRPGRLRQLLPGPRLGGPRLHDGAGPGRGGGRRDRRPRPAHELVAASTSPASPAGDAVREDFIIG